MSAGEIDIGIVCGQCDRYSPMGAARCSECGNDLALYPANAPRRGPTSAAAAAAAAFDPEEAARKTRSDRKPEQVLEPDAGPPSSVFESSSLKPRRTKSDDQVASVSPRHQSTPRMDRPRVTPAARPGVRPQPQSPAPAPGASARTGPSTLSLEELMEQAKHFVCRSCSTPVPMGHKFCGRCGAAIPPEIVNARTQFFGQLQAPGKAKLILIRGEGVEGLSYQLNAEQHIVGRQGQLVFPDDPFVSPKHANLFYRNGKLVVRDEGSLNGVFLRVRGTVDLAAGDTFLCGEQLFRFDLAPPANEGPGPDGTYFYASPKHQSAFRVTQILQGGAFGMTVCARSTSLQIGREGGDINFPVDLYMSATHCRVEESGSKHTLTDLNSRNGTYVRLSAERELSHGDYLFIGRKLLRVEITAA